MFNTCRDVSSKDLYIPRPFYSIGHGGPIHQQLFAFADASDLAWCYVIYLRTITSDNKIHVAFVCGNTKVLPKGVCVKGQLSIPRAELNAATDLATKVLEVETELDMPHRHPTVFYSDSKDVLAWIKNDATNEAPKRYIVNRINTIRKISDPDQWHYIPTKQNPADYGTRPISVEELRTSCWLSGPEFLFLEDPKPLIIPSPDISSTIPYTAPSVTFFLTRNRSATEEITTGTMWKNLLDETLKQTNATNIQEVSIILQKDMQREAWPMKSINKQESKKCQELLAKAHSPTKPMAL